MSVCIPRESGFGARCDVVICADCPCQTSDGPAGRRYERDLLVSVQDDLGLAVESGEAPTKGGKEN